MPVVFTKDKRIDIYDKTGFFLLRSYNKGKIKQEIK